MHDVYINIGENNIEYPNDMQDIYNIEYSHDMQDVYKDIDECNADKKNRRY